MYAANDMDPRWLMENIKLIGTHSGGDDLIEAAQEAVVAGKVLPRFEVGLWLFLDQPQRVYAAVDSLRNQKKALDFVLLFGQEAAKFRDSDEFAQITKETGLDAYWEQYQGPDAFR